ncbi:MAG: replication-associated recombination protein A [Dictyoglomaceae bacterium]
MEQEGLFKEDKKYQPLAYRMRPRSFDELVGLSEVIGENSFLRKAIRKGYLPSLIIYGPPGSGKTTLSILLAQAINADFIELNAAIVGVSEIRDALQRAKRNIEMFKKNTVLFLDEIHHFNKLQQDVLLPWVEKGLVILIGATTENPFFTLNTTLLSRCRLIELKPLSPEDIRKIIKRAIKDKERGLGSQNIVLEESAEEEIIRFARGDARVALNTLELASFLAIPDSEGRNIINLSVIEEVVQKRILRYDQRGDEHYHVISAFIKSIRGSDPDAAVYWLSRMLLSGEDPRFIARRLIVHAAEDIGMADPFALVIAQAAAFAVEFVGMPEAQIPLTTATIYLACAPKSNSSLIAINKANEYLQKYGPSPVPLHLRNPSFKEAEKLGYGKDYKYPHDYPGHFVEESYLPEDVKERFYYPSEEGREKMVKERLKKLWKRKYEG